MHCNLRWGGLLGAAFSHFSTEPAETAETLVGDWRPALLVPPSRVAAAKLQHLTRTSNLNICTIPDGSLDAPPIGATTPRRSAGGMLRAAAFPGRIVATFSELTPWLVTKGGTRCRGVSVSRAPPVFAVPPPVPPPGGLVAAPLLDLLHRVGEAVPQLLVVDLGPEEPPLTQHVTF